MGFKAAALTPELIVRDIHKSLEFYCDILGFRVVYETPADKFAYLALGDAQLMLEEIVDLHGSYITAPLEHPYGRGMNFKILVPDATRMYEIALQAGCNIVRPLEEQWYPKDAGEIGNNQFMIADPDGYVLRFSTDLGERPRSE